MSTQCVAIHEQVIDLAGLVLSFALLDYTNGKGGELAVVAKYNLVAAVSFLQRRDDAALRSITPMRGKRLYQLLPRMLAIQKGKD